MFATPRALALSYFEPYIDFTGGVKGYAVVDLRVLGGYDWRLSERTCGRSSRCCSTGRIGAIRILDGARRARCARQVSRVPGGARLQAAGSSIRRDAIAGRSCRRNSRGVAESVQIEIARRLRDRLLACACLQRLLEAPRQRIAARLLGLDRLLEERLAARRLLGEDPLRLGQLGLVAALRLLVRDDAPEVVSTTSVARQQGQVSSISAPVGMSTCLVAVTAVTVRSAAITSLATHDP